MTGEWAGVIAAADQLAAALEDGAPLAGAAEGLLAELAYVWTVGGVLTSPGTPPTADPTLATRSPAVAQTFAMKFTGEDRPVFAAWLEQCKQAGAADTMTDAIRLAVRLASSIPTEQLTTMRAGNV